jgi:hypothetical protein
VIERIKTRIKPIWTGHRNLVLAVGAIAIVAIVGTGLLVGLGLGHSSPASTPSPIASSSQIAIASPTESPSPTPTSGPTAIPSGWEYSDLDGVAAPADLAHRLPIAVMVDDNIVARPQSGFTAASIVYQAPADGGEDRYMLIFQEGTATDIGPVRSARPYYVYWAAEYKAGFGHYGGDITSLQQVIPSMAKYIYNMDALNGDACPYHRVTTRPGPHNAYTNTAALVSCAARIGQPAKYQGLPARTFVDDTPVSDRPASQSISIPYRTGMVGYQFDPASDSYLRSVDGKPQIDPAGNQQVVARNVIVTFQALSYDAKSDPGHNRPVIASVGSGKAIVFKEGQAIEATWKKASNAALTRLYDSSGNEIPLVRGEIFIQCVPTGTAVTYK